MVGVAGTGAAPGDAIDRSILTTVSRWTDPSMCIMIVSQSERNTYIGNT